MTLRFEILGVVYFRLQHFPRFEGGYDTDAHFARVRPTRCNTFPVLKGVMTLIMSLLWRARLVATLSPF